MPALPQLWAMAAKDLRRRLRSPLPTLLQLLFPLIFAGLIAMVFGSGEAKAPKVRLLLEDRDGGLVGRLVASAFGQGEAAKYFEVVKVAEVRGDGADLLEKEDAAALLRLPPGFTDAVLAGRPATIGLVQSPAQANLPQVAEQMTAVLAEALSAASRAFRGPLDKVQGVGGRPTDAQVAEIAVLANQALSGSNGGTSYLLPPVVTLTTAVRPDPKRRVSFRGSGRGPSSSSCCPGSRFSPCSTSRPVDAHLPSKRGRRPCAASSPGRSGAGRLVGGKGARHGPAAGLSLLSLSLAGALARWTSPRREGPSTRRFRRPIAGRPAATGFSSFLPSPSPGARAGRRWRAPDPADGLAGGASRAQRQPPRRA
jgi:hypothetical protein